MRSYPNNQTLGVFLCAIVGVAIAVPLASNWLQSQSDSAFAVRINPPVSAAGPKMAGDSPSQIIERELQSVPRPARIPSSLEGDDIATSAIGAQYIQQREITSDTIAAAAAKDLVQPTTILPVSLAAPVDEIRPNQFRIPVGNPAAQERVQLSKVGERLTLVVRDAALNDILGVISEQYGLNIVAPGGATQRVSLTLTNVTLEQALNALLTNLGFTWSNQDGVVLVSQVDTEKKVSPFVQGRILRVFDLNYLRASDADKVVKGLLSPVGQSFVAETSPLDKLRTREQLIVEDMPQYLLRVEQYLAASDCPPQQVLVEANILQVTLKGVLKHGVNFQALAHVNGADVTIGTNGFAAPLASPTAFLRVDGTDLDSFIDCLKTTTDVKTLASPKVFVLNGQEAKIQIGGTIGYLQTTTTQTSTLQSVNFLPIGVILNVTPFITKDQQVLLQVAPEVSTGRINPTTQLPDSETTRVNTQVMLANGQAIVIGGLIKETDNETINKIPWLGDIWLLGHLFQNRTTEREKNEIIITLRTYIAPYAPPIQARECQELERTSTPLLQGALYPACRPYEPKFPCADDRPWERGWPVFGNASESLDNSSAQPKDSQGDIRLLPQHELLPPPAVESPGPQPVPAPPPAPPAPMPPPATAASQPPALLQPRRDGPSPFHGSWEGDIPTIPVSAFPTHMYR